MNIKDQIYFILESTVKKNGSSVKINDFNIQLPFRFRHYFQRDYEVHNFSFFRKHVRQGMTCIDVGAHFGLFSVYMAKFSEGTVYSFEAAPGTFKILLKVIELNKFSDRIKPINAAVSNCNGKAAFFIGDQVGTPSNSLVNDLNPDFPKKTDYVELVSLDDFASRQNIKFDFLKIDAEGAEFEVLQGARDSIVLDRPFIILSVHPQLIIMRGSTQEMIWECITGMDYKILLDDKEIDKDSFCNRKTLFDVHLISNK